jgi:hypothetical protein
MVKSASGKKDMRSFTVVDVRLANGKATKFSDSMRFVNKTPAQAAQKAGHELCRMHKVKGRCVFKICVQETTQGSSGKQHTYTFKRVKLDTPVEIGDRKYFFTSKVYAEKDMKPVERKTSKKSVGKGKKSAGKGSTKSTKGKKSAGKGSAKSTKGKKQTKKSFLSRLFK